VGVNVDVGISVGEGEMVTVAVAMAVCEARSINVGEGSGLTVHVASIILFAEGCVINVNSPHPITNSAAKDIQIKNFCKLLMFPAESFENYPVGAAVHRMLCKGRRLEQVFPIKDD
jgi:hypothetical protein